MMLHLSHLSHIGNTVPVSQFLTSRLLSQSWLVSWQVWVRPSLWSIWPRLKMAQFPEYCAKSWLCLLRSLPNSNRFRIWCRPKRRSRYSPGRICTWKQSTVSWVTEDKTCGVMGYSLVHLLLRSYRTLIHLLRTARFAGKFRWAHFLACSLTPKLVGKGFSSVTWKTRRFHTVSTHYLLFSDATTNLCVRRERISGVNEMPPMESYKDIDCDRLQDSIEFAIHANLNTLIIRWIINIENGEKFCILKKIRPFLNHF